MQAPNDYGLIPVKIIKPGVPMMMIGQVGGFNPTEAQMLIDRGYAVEWTKKDQAELDAASNSKFGATGPISPNPGGGPPGTQTGHNVADLSNGPGTGVVASLAGPVNQDGSVSVRSIGDMTEQPNKPVLEGGTLGSGAGSQNTEEVSVLKGADGEDVEVPLRWEDKHHTQIKSIARRISGNDDLTMEQSKEVITKALAEKEADGEE